MKVFELKKLLLEIPDDWEVVMSKDGEGNGHSPLADFSDQYHYVPDSTWSGELWGHEDDDMEKPDNAVKCLVLWPTN